MHSTYSITTSRLLEREKRHHTHPIPEAEFLTHKNLGLPLSENPTTHQIRFLIGPDSRTCKCMYFFLFTTPYSTYSGLACRFWDPLNILAFGFVSTYLRDDFLVSLGGLAEHKPIYPLPWDEAGLSPCVSWLMARGYCLGFK